mmetsp:Transcript_46225/g.122537  ORF Transcript_46225/g.122537 Transcript_46225/m.122537 type:complete len:272 (+) Transcript_46225:326-1141(+)
MLGPRERRRERKIDYRRLGGLVHIGQAVHVHLVVDDLRHELAHAFLARAEQLGHHQHLQARRPHGQREGHLLHLSRLLLDVAHLAWRLRTLVHAFDGAAAHPDRGEQRVDGVARRKVEGPLGAQRLHEALVHHRQSVDESVTGQCRARAHQAGGRAQQRLRRGRRQIHQEALNEEERRLRGLKARHLQHVDPARFAQVGFHHDAGARQRRRLIKRVQALRLVSVSVGDVDLEDFDGLVHSRHAPRTRVQADPQDDKLLATFVQGRDPFCIE